MQQNKIVYTVLQYVIQNRFKTDKMSPNYNKILEKYGRQKFTELSLYY